MSTALTQLYYHTMARPRVVSEKESLLEGESGPTPAEKTLPTPCQQDRSWPSLEDGERRRHTPGKYPGYTGYDTFCDSCGIFPVQPPGGRVLICCLAYSRKRSNDQGKQK